MKQNLERDKAIAKARKSGLTLKEIGSLFSLSKERVRQICKERGVINIDPRVVKGNLVRLKILKRIEMFWLMNCYAPSYRDICKEMNDMSLSVLKYHLKIMKNVDKTITYVENEARTIRPVNIWVVYKPRKLDDA